ncbi:hypothetical protein HUT16_16280 [Kitasatospora sp. NA04385]|uniref:hypothetical protein n=1 Tax=Kitasatospora sp. NA04385 TaxID=2742135 RepID=UPI0015916DF9|nr:hypothetical protein [Kitasatospora sp. NA04385]QKW20418.1 hypothetical protein HUT16_16280 [Kitasatospora sp. NA04385]
MPGYPEVPLIRPGWWKRLGLVTLATLVLVVVVGVIEVETHPGPGGRTGAAGAPGAGAPVAGSAAPSASSPVRASPRRREIYDFRMPDGMQFSRSHVELHPVYLVSAYYTVQKGGRFGSVRVDATHVPEVPRGGTYRPSQDCGGVSWCTVTTREDGSVLRVETPGAGADGYPQDWTVAVYRTDGSEVTAVFSVFAEADRSVLTVDQLTRVALFPDWQTVAEQVPEGSA